MNIGCPTPAVIARSVSRPCDLNCESLYAKPHPITGKVRLWSLLGIPHAVLQMPFELLFHAQVCDLDISLLGCWERSITVVTTESFRTIIR